MPSQKGFSPVILILGLLLISGLLAGAFFLGRNISDKSNVDQKNAVASAEPGVVAYVPPPYLEFTHPAKGFSFEYPSGWIYKNEPGDVSWHSTDFYLYTDGDPSNSETEVEVMNLTIIDSPLQIVKGSYPQASNIQMDSKTGLRDGNKVLIPLGTSDSSVALLTFENKEHIDHIISTIKFSEQAKIDDPESWTLYEDQINRFSFKYPQIFKLEKTNNGVKLYYDHPSAAGMGAAIPAKLVFEVNAVQTSEKADVYAERITRQRLQDFGLNEPCCVVSSQQIDFLPAQTTGISPDKTSREAVSYYFVDLNNKVIEIIAYYPNAKSLNINQTNVLDYIVYRIKFKK